MVNPPTDAEKELYVYQDKWTLYGIGIPSVICLMIGMALFCFHHPSLYIFLLFFALLVFYLLISYFVGVMGTPFDYAKHKDLRDSSRDFQPAVDIFLPCCNEPLEVLENTYKHIKNIKHNSYNVYVLDDGHSNDVRMLANRYDFNYIRRPVRENKKAGNLRYAFAETYSPFIAIFDADFAPRPDFFAETLHYFKDQKIAIVQTPQFFNISNNQTWVQKGSAFVQELFYRLIQVNRNTFGASICVGTNAVYRREALKPFGGTALIDYSEDLHTGFSVIEAGWKLTYIPLNLAQGICPETTQAFFSQQYRWAMGSLSLFTNKRFWVAKIPIMMRLSYMSGMIYYLTTGLGVLITPLPGMIMILFFREAVFWYNLMFSLPSLILGTYILAKWSKLPFGFYYMKVRALSFYAHLFAVIDKLRGDLMEWIPSGSQGHKSNRYINARNLLHSWSTICILVTVSASFYNFKLAFIPFLLVQLLHYYIQTSILRDQ